MPIPVTVIDSEPCAQYQGVVYDRDVVVEFTDGTRIGAFNPDVRVTASLVGETHAMHVRLLTSEDSFEQTDDRAPGIDPNPDESLGWHSHTFSGRVEERFTTERRTGGEADTVVLDVGLGTVEFRLARGRRQDIELGSFLAVTANRTDVYAELRDDESDE